MEGRQNPVSAVVSTPPKCIRVSAEKDCVQRRQAGRQGGWSGAEPQICTLPHCAHPSTAVCGGAWRCLATLTVQRHSSQHATEKNLRRPATQENANDSRPVVQKPLPYIHSRAGRSGPVGT